MAAFPAYALLLFDPQADRAPQPAVDRTEMERGPPKQLPRATRAMVRLPVQYILKTQADYLSFVTFFNDTLRKGADWFDWTDPAGNVVRQARIVGGEIRYRPTRRDLERWIVSFELEYWG